MTSDTRDATLPDSLNSLDALVSFFTSPCDSKLICIAVLHDERGNRKQELIEEKKLKPKAVCQPHKNQNNVDHSGVERGDHGEG
ncbi:unnamed protein product [Arctogadus glacialis]